MEPLSPMTTPIAACLNAMTTDIGGQSLRSRVLRACNWTVGGHIAGQVLRLGTNLVMTRMLVPEMFGILALANVIMFGLQMISDLGLRQNIVQSQRGNDPAFLNTAWTIQILRGVLLWLTTLSLSLGIHLLAQLHWWPAGSVYTESVLPYVIACLSFSVLLSGFESTKLATAGRNLVLGRVTLIEFLSQIAALASMLAWASIDRSIWALVIGALVFNLLKMLLSHYAMPGEMNRLEWNKDAFREIFRFGKWVFLSSLIGFVAASGDRFLLGGLTDSATLGLYSIALLIYGAFRDLIVRLIDNISLPVFSEVVHERQSELKAMYYRIRLPLDIVTLFVTGFFFSAGHLFIQALYDDRYLAAGSMFEVLQLSLFEIRYTLVFQCFLALGMPKLLIPVTLIRTAALYGLIPLTYAHFGIEGVLWVICGSYFLTIPYLIAVKLKHGLFDLVNEIKVLPLLLCGYLVGQFTVGLIHL